MAMEKQEIIGMIDSRHKAFIDYLNGLSVDAFEYRHNGEKWSAGQELTHILKGISSLVRVLKIPKISYPTMFGTSNRPSRTYDELIKRYKEKADLAGNKTIPAFESDPPGASQRKSLLEKLEKKVKSLCKLADKFSEEQLDYYILPHPLLGKLTVREILYFMAFHVDHHRQNSIRNLAGMS